MICILQYKFQGPISSETSDAKVKPVLGRGVQADISVSFDLYGERIERCNCGCCNVPSWKAAIDYYGGSQLYVGSVGMPSDCLLTLGCDGACVIIMHLRNKVYFSIHFLINLCKIILLSMIAMGIRIQFDILKPIIMSVQGKKNLNEIITKKTAPTIFVNIKCSVCGKYFTVKKEYDAHLQLHRNQLDRTNVEQLQRKTQQSFRSKRKASAVVRTTSVKEKEKDKKEEDLATQEKQKNGVEVSEEYEGKQQQQLQQALRQSQIMLQKIEFLTQIADFSKQQSIPAVVGLDEEEDEEKTIENQHSLYLLLCSSKNTQKVQNLILKTNFEQTYFQNYQEQLKNLKDMMKGESNPDSLAKFSKMIKSISNDVISRLKEKFDSTLSKQSFSRKQEQIIKSSQNVGEVAYCSLCYNEIQCGSSYLYSQLGTIYHKECYQEKQ